MTPDRRNGAPLEADMLAPAEASAMPSQRFAEPDFDEDQPGLDDMSWSGGFFAGAGRAEWLKVLEHQLRFGSDLILLCGEPGVGKTTLLRQLAARLDPALYVMVTCDAGRSGAPDLLWSAMDRTLKLGTGPEGWERLKRIARKHAASGQALVILIDHADTLNDESLELVAAMLDARLAEVRLLLVLDQANPQFEGGWEPLAARLSNRGQILRVRPFSVAESVEYLSFRVKHARIAESALDQRQLRQVVTTAMGLPSALDIGLKTAIRRDELGNPLAASDTGPETRGTRSGKKEKAAKGVRPGKAPAEKPARPARVPKPKKPFTPPKPHTVALFMLAVCLLGFYIVWEKPVPRSVIATPAPNAQNLPPPVKPPSEAEEARPTLTETLLDVIGKDKEPELKGGVQGGVIKTGEQPLPATRPGGLPPVIKPAPVVVAASEPAQTSVTAGPGAAMPPAAPEVSAAAVPAAPSAVAPVVQAPVIPVLPAPPARAPSRPAATPPAVQADTPVAASAPPAAARVEPAPPRPDPTPAIGATGTFIPGWPVDDGAGRVARDPVPVAPETVAEEAAPAAAGSSGRLPFSGNQGFTLQIMGLRDEAAVKSILRQNAGVDKLGYYASRLGGRPWYVVVQGQYPDARSANAAVSRLPAALRAGKPFPKSIQAIRGEMR